MPDDYESDSVLLKVVNKNINLTKSLNRHSMLRGIDYTTLPSNVKSLKNYYDESTYQITNEFLEKLSEPVYELHHDYNGVITKTTTYNIPNDREGVRLEY